MILMKSFDYFGCIFTLIDVVTHENIWPLLKL